MSTPPDLAIPTLPGRSLPETLRFYAALGFEGELIGDDGGYLIVTRGAVELHFFPHPGLVPAHCDHGAYLRVADVEAWHRELAAAQLPRDGIPCMGPVEDKPWGMREFVLVDADGNLLRIGQVLPDD
jgi:catechol 2,3-dioxygenase-like lactoylglutathione lyase family enzyme